MKGNSNCATLTSRKFTGVVASVEGNPIANIVCFGFLPPFQMFPVHSGSKLNIILAASQKANQSPIAN
jgi:hypothetical protein